jgi:hypothetical protein
MNLTPQQQITLIREAMFLLPHYVLTKGYGMCVTIEQACENLGEPFTTWVKSSWYPLTDLGLVNPVGDQDNSKHWFPQYDYLSRVAVLRTRLKELEEKQYEIKTH